MYGTILPLPQLPQQFTQNRTRNLNSVTHTCAQACHRVCTTSLPPCSHIQSMIIHFYYYLWRGGFLIWVSSLHYADDVVLLEFLGQDLHCALGWFTVDCEVVGMGISYCPISTSVAQPQLCSNRHGKIPIPPLFLADLRLIQHLYFCSPLLWRDRWS